MENIQVDESRFPISLASHVQFPQIVAKRRQQRISTVRLQPLSIDTALPVMVRDVPVPDLLPMLEPTSSELPMPSRRKTRLFSVLVDCILLVSIGLCVLMVCYILTWWW